MAMMFGRGYVIGAMPILDGPATVEEPPDQLFEEPAALAYWRKASGQKVTQEDFDSRSSFGFPDGRHPSEGPHGLPDMTRAVWSRRMIDRWIADRRAFIARLERVVGRQR